MKVASRIGICGQLDVGSNFFFGRPVRYVANSAMQRLEPVADLIRLHDAGHQAVIGSPSSAAATMTGIEGTSVLRGSGLHVS